MSIRNFINGLPSRATSLKPSAEHRACFAAACLLFASCAGVEPGEGTSEAPEGVRTFSGTLTEQANGLTLDDMLFQFSCTIEYTTSLQAAENVRMSSVSSLFQATAPEAVAKRKRADIQADEAALGEAIGQLMQDFAKRGGPSMPWFKFDVACTQLGA